MEIQTFTHDGKPAPSVNLPQPILDCAAILDRYMEQHEITSLCGLLRSVGLPTLTPAQQHADKLAELLRHGSTEMRQNGRRTPQWALDAAELLKKIPDPDYDPDACTTCGR